MGKQMTDIKRIDIKEFVDFGYLQEVNRQFFHPLGLALEVVVNEDGSKRLGGIWDYRDDPEGVFFAEGELDLEKWKNVERVRSIKNRTRLEKIRYTVQPMPHSVLWGYPDDKGDVDWKEIKSASTISWDERYDQER